MNQKTEEHASITKYTTTQNEPKELKPGNIWGKIQVISYDLRRENATGLFGEKVDR